MGKIYKFSPKEGSFLIEHISLFLNLFQQIHLQYHMIFTKFGVFERNRYYPTWKDMRYGAFSAFIVIMMFFDGV